GGNITDDGNASVTERGICWSTSQNPTISDSHTTNGTGEGSFVSNITGLSHSTTYFVRAYAINSIGIGYVNAVSFTTLSLGIGDSFQGGVIAYVLQDGDIGYVSGEFHGIIAATADLGIYIEWGCEEVLLSGVFGSEIGAGTQNTSNILNGCSESGIAALLCANYSNEGYDDWFLPSPDELAKLYLNRIEISGFSPNFYWSSRQTNSWSAYLTNFDNGEVYADLKSQPYRVRSIRIF
ncbi:MAG: DUF1566 domain-containing protein, partial [Bacteroidales bacterium]|nr:DUF1566 domain-containing protein [Bacteroidales bacterium]